MAKQDLEVENAASVSAVTTTADGSEAAPIKKKRHPLALLLCIISAIVLFIIGYIAGIFVQGHLPIVNELSISGVAGDVYDALMPCPEESSSHRGPLDEPNPFGEHKGGI